MAHYALYVDEGMAYPVGGAPFRPSTAFPEYPFPPDSCGGNNPVYEGVRELFRVAGLDAGNYGTAKWNPLGEYVLPGERVLVKPNLVMHENPTGNGTDCLYTHPSVIAAVIDYVVIALHGGGHITLADAPMQSCDWGVLVDTSGIGNLVEWYRGQGIDIELKDLRGLKSTPKAGGLTQEIVEGSGGKVVDLSDSSSFNGLSQERIDSLRITNYDPRELARHHTSGKHEYFVSDELLRADVVVNLPKAKTHRKAGVTGALKNMVGVNVRKEYLPHHSNGSVAEGRDEYEKKSISRRFASLMLDRKNESMAMGGLLPLRWACVLTARLASVLGKRMHGDPYSEGSWWGNDTIWRTVVDLNKIVAHADKCGALRKERQRKMIVVCDMVTIGQGEAPLLPEPGEWHMLAFADDPASHDCAMARLMGTDESLIPTVHNALSYNGPYAFSSDGAAEAVCSSNDPRFNGLLVSELNEDMTYRAIPTAGWSARFERGA